MSKSWEKLSEFFNSKGIFPLVNPRERLDPGVVYQTEDDGIHAHRFTKLPVILAHKSDPDRQYVLPEKEPDAPGNRLAGTIESGKSLNLAFDFLQAVFDRIKAGLSLKIRAQHADRKAGIFRIDSISTEELDIGQLRESVKNYKVKKDSQLNLSPKNYYIVTKTWYSDSISILVGDLNKQGIELYTELFRGQVAGKFEKIDESVLSYPVCRNAQM